MPSLITKEEDSSSLRVILLLDLDCFYAQCECVRLGWDATTTPLALLQWNSVLAVTYPARESYKIKRGDSWDAVRQKSNGNCHAIHVPILTTTANDNNITATTNVHRSIQDEYQSIFQLLKEQQLQARHDELGVRRLSSEGKACIERYRIASACILQAVSQWIETSTFSNQIILERASIDEFFLDVTQACTSTPNQQPQDSFQTALEQTKIVGKDKVSVDPSDPDVLLLQRGCHIAYSIRKAVYDQLGFTLSAGISINKTIAKLSASYGKPNGQAVTYPTAVESILQDTPISKCRNLGGKLGARVQALLPANVPTTVASIARYLSLPDLQQGLGNDSETASWVYQAARGIDHEVVAPKSESSVATKSITAFKSLPFLNKGHSLQDAAPWIRLLAQEIVTRVERDQVRNQRYPRTCSIQYAAGKSRQNKSVRFAFPADRLTTDEKIAQLCEATPKAIQQKEGDSYRLHRVGLCAVDFGSRESSTQGIDTFFCKAKDAPGESKPAPLVVEERKRPPKEDEETTVDADFELAKKLQASYDREHRVLQTLDKKDSTRPPKKTRKIDSFFQKR